MTYSIDFRRKVLSVQAKEGLTNAEVANRFNVGVASIVRWRGKLEPILKRNKPTKLDMSALKADVSAYPDSYHYERAKRFGVTASCILKALRRLGVSYKKNTIASESGRKRTAHLPRKD